MKLNKVFVIFLLLANSLPTLGLSQVVVLGAPTSAGSVQTGSGNSNPSLVDQRAIGIAPQASEPTIGPQFNQPMIGQQGPPPAQTGFAQQAQVSQPGVQAGLSDQGIILPAPGTIVVGPQADTTIVVPQGGIIGVGQKANPTVINPQGQTPAITPNGTAQNSIAPNNIAPSITSGSVSPAIGPQSTTSIGQPQTITPALSPTGRGAASATTSSGSAAAGK